MFTGFKLLYDDWRGYVISGFTLVWLANHFMSIFGRLRLGIKSERIEVSLKEELGIRSRRAASPHFGALVHDGGVPFSVWAPAQTSLALVIENGAEIPHAGRRKRLHAATPRRRNPVSVTGIAWSGTAAGSGVPLPAGRAARSLGNRRSARLSLDRYGLARRAAGASPILYEMHIGTFTEEGTWNAAATRLPAPRRLG